MENTVLISKRPKVGIGVLVVRDGQLLLGERIYAHGSGTWCPPGGHLEFGESPSECAARELEEETGLIATDIVSGPWTNDFFEVEEKHYVTLFMFVRDFRGTPKVTEPEKCSSWRWFDFDDLPHPLFLSLSHLLETSPLESLTSNYLL
ncbi:Nudix hydrolase 1 [Chlamydiales bacterium SCGC AG-110-P3]|nr:Nudix hydrolase 1 [Chlamydiales bacterium SCGC AG-110-P3]